MLQYAIRQYGSEKSVGKRKGVGGGACDEAVRAASGGLGRVLHVRVDSYVCALREDHGREMPVTASHVEDGPGKLNVFEEVGLYRPHDDAVKRDFPQMGAEDSLRRVSGHQRAAPAALR